VAGPGCLGRNWGHGCVVTLVEFMVSELPAGLPAAGVVGLQIRRGLLQLGS